MSTTTRTRSLEKQNFDEIRSDIFKTLNDCLQNRFQVDEEIIKIVKPFVDFQEDANIRQIHKIFEGNLPMSMLCLDSLIHNLFNQKTIRNLVYQNK